MGKEGFVEKNETDLGRWEEGYSAFKWRCRGPRIGTWVVDGRHAEEERAD